MKTALRASGALILALAVAASSTAAEHQRCVQVPRERFNTFMMQMRQQPVFRSGGIIGYRIYEFAGRNKLPALGLQQGDLITHFCGLPVAEVFMGDEGDLCCKGRVGETVYVDIERNGQKMRVKSSIPPPKS
jgi:type II secretory pathway component PulC